jgi:hypothetical protein
MSTRPLLDQHDERSQGLNFPILHKVFPSKGFASLSTAHDGIEIMLQCQDNDMRDELTKRWRNHKLEELNFVGTVVCYRAVDFPLQFHP